MPTFYNYTEGGYVYSFDDVFVPADAFRQGNLWAWGDNTNGQLGTNDTGTKLTPVTTFAGGTNWKQVSCGSAQVAIKTDGTLWVWGRNNSGNLGTNDVIYRSTPVTTFAGGTNWKQVAAGSNSIAAIKTDGTLWTWGDNSTGQLGTNDAINRSTPVTTFAGGTNWKQVSCLDFTAAIKTDGTLWTWGRNSYGQLGNNVSPVAGGLGSESTNRSTPITTFAGGNNWKQVVSGNACTAAIKTDGTLWTWGRNNFGQLGNNDGINKSTPVTTFAGGTNWKQVSSDQFTAAIKTDGTLWTWGNNRGAQLGTNDTTTRYTPVTTFAGGTNWKQVNCGYLLTEAIKTDGTLWVWGSNNGGQLGINDSNGIFGGRTTPVTTFAGGTNWKQVVDGSSGAITYIDSYQ